MMNWTENSYSKIASKSHIYKEMPSNTLN